MSDAVGSEERTVLVAEDDRDFRETLEIWLSEAGWTVIPVADGAEALAALGDHVDLFVCDRRMPGRTGAEVLARLDETTFDGPVIVLSSREPDDYLGRDDVARYFVKPVERGVLVEAVDTAVVDPVA